MTDAAAADPICFRCLRKPDQISEYVMAAAEINAEEQRPASAALTPAAYVRMEEGTYNPDNGHFCCTECYIAIGQPSSPRGWKAP